MIEVFSRRGLNIGAQYLQTDGEIGYVVVDIDGGAEEADEIRSELRAIEGTLRSVPLRPALSGSAGMTLPQAFAFAIVAAMMAPLRLGPARATTSWRCWRCSARS